MTLLLLALLTTFAVCRADAAAAADRTAYCDAAGVLRWREGGDEVAVFGVNYYTPFHTEYRETVRRGFDPKEVIRRDVAHLRRLGLDAMRLHCFDREISDRAGNLLDNVHLDLLDYLIAVCASNGIHTVLTPIAGWGYRDGDATNGFSYAATRARLASEPALITVQQRYEEQFARHVNRYTGRRYADDPAVLAFELINEPDYPPDFTAAQIASYANALLDGLRHSGTIKPVFYNALWNAGKALDAAPLLRTDGVSGECYCTGLRAGHVLEGLQLKKAVATTFARAGQRLAGKAKIVYEFDAADMTGAYMYPALASAFRSFGVQSATQFQYESMPVAADNPSYKTHYLNLVYTPEKALSLAIAAEVFRRRARGAAYQPDENEIVFPPFRVNAAANLSEMASEEAYLYTAAPLTPPPAPERLKRVWGCGASAVAASSGTGAYFLDRAAKGVWRLQVYPSVLPIADPHTGLPGPKTVILPDSVTLTVTLVDLGTDFTVSRMDSGTRVTVAAKGRFTVAPGDYLLTVGAGPTPEACAAARALNVPDYWAPPPDPPDPSRRPWPPKWEEVVAAARQRATTAKEWNWFDVTAAVCAGGGRTQTASGRPACRFKAENFVDRSSLMARVPSKGRLWAAIFPEAPQPTELFVAGRSLTAHVEPVELAFRFADGSVWGEVVTFPPEETVLRLPMEKLRYFGHWPNTPKFKAGMRPDIRQLEEISLGIGRWLHPKIEDRRRAHIYEISAIHFR